MRIVAISDIHGRIGQLDIAAADLERSDLVLLTGDITNFGRRAEAKRMLEPIRAHNQSLLAVRGNCDYPEVEELLDDLGINLHAAARQVDGVSVIGLAGSLPGPAPTPHEYSEGQLEQFLQLAAEDIEAGSALVLNSHQPPVSTVADQLPDGSHVGSTAVRQFIEEHQPLVCFTGHIHEGVGVDEIGATKIVNPGPLQGGRYGYAEIEAGKLVTAEVRGPSS